MMTRQQLALVTGATSGIGKAVCQLLAKKGITLIASGRDFKRLEELQQELSSQVVVQLVQADLSQPEGRQKLIQALHEHSPDIVINNAGFGLYGDALTYSTKEQAEILEINGKAVLELTLEAARTLVSNKQSGVILNVSSVSGFQVLPTLSVYAASKAFVNSFSQALDFEVSQYGVRVLAICPGMVDTAFQTRASGNNASQTQPQALFMSAEFVAEKIWEQITQRRPLSIINWQYRLLTWLSYLFPKKCIAATVKRVISQRIGPRTLIKINE